MPDTFSERWRMPAETAPHEQTWMAWPSGGYTLGDSAADADEARSAWAAVANAVHDFEPVQMLVPAQEVQHARRLLAGGVDVHEVPLDDAWFRDIGPTFVSGPRGLGAVNWVFNGWGQQPWATWEQDASASEVATRLAGAESLRSPLVNEGGGLHTDGAGTFLATRTVQLDPLRNPGWNEAQVEAELSRTLGAEKVIWLPRGLFRDHRGYGTKGHVDVVATFTAPGRLLVHDQRDTEHPDASIMREIRAALRPATDARGKPLELVSLPAPTVLRDADGWVDYSYVNHYVVNSAVIMGAFGDPVDDEAAEILADSYTGREVVRVDARALFARGGGPHCITQQQPAISADVFVAPSLASRQSREESQR